MRNIQLTIAYDGTGYAGWQKQKNSATIQGEIEQRLQTITRESVILHGAGRTDAGVHARAMTANFHTHSPIPCQALCKGLNSLLPRAIRILDSRERSPDFHARFSALAKTYTYTLFTGAVQPPLQRLYTVHYYPLPYQEAMQACLQRLVGTHDFASFEASGSRDPTIPGKRGSVRTLHEAIFTELAAQTCQFQFTGDGFLRHMVRNLVGTLLEVGTGRRSSKQFEQTLHARNRSSAGPTAPAHGLVLEKIFYE